MFQSKRLCLLFGIGSYIAHRPSVSGSFISYPFSRRLRNHYVVIEDLAEEWFAERAGKCDQFVNIKSINPFTLSCTECEYFESCVNPQSEQGEVPFGLKLAHTEEKPTRHPR